MTQCMSLVPIPSLRPSLRPSRSLDRPRMCPVICQPCERPSSKTASVVCYSSLHFYAIIMNHAVVGRNLSCFGRTTVKLKLTTAHWIMFQIWLVFQMFHQKHLQHQPQCGDICNWHLLLQCLGFFLHKAVSFTRFLRFCNSARSTSSLPWSHCCGFVDGSK